MPKRVRAREIVRYCLAGLVGVGAYYGLLYALTEYAGWWYIVSATVASIVNFASNFLLQKFWTFKNHDRGQISGQAFQYALLYTGLTLANLIGLYVLTEYANWWYIAAQIPVSVLLTAVGYVVSRLIFKT